jgi:hypothetical protein
MHAAHVVLVRPNLVHLLEIQGLEHSVKPRVRLLHLGPLVVGGQGPTHAVLRPIGSTGRFYQIDRAWANIAVVR